MNIQGLPDTPNLIFGNYDNKKLKIENNGWLNIDEILPSVLSSDEDGSEEYSLLIKLLNQDGTLSNINNELRLNINDAKQLNGGWIIKSSQISKKLEHILAK